MPIGGAPRFIEVLCVDDKQSRKESSNSVRKKNGGYDRGLTSSVRQRLVTGNYMMAIESGRVKGFQEERLVTFDQKRTIARVEVRGNETEYKTGPGGGGGGEEFSVG